MMIYTYFFEQSALCCLCFLPYLLIGAAALPIILTGMLYGSLQIVFIYIGLVDVEMVQKDFLPKLLQKILP